MPDDSTTEKPAPTLARASGGPARARRNNREVLRNLTGHHVSICDHAGEVCLYLAPWETTFMETEGLDSANLEPWTRRAILDRRKLPPPRPPWLLTAVGAFFGVGVWGVIIWLGWRLLAVFADSVGAPDTTYWIVTAAIMVLVALVVGALVGFVDRRDEDEDEDSGAGASGSGSKRWGIRAPAIRRAIALAAWFAVIVAISIGLPMVVITAGGSWNPVNFSVLDTPDSFGESLQYLLMQIPWLWASEQDMVHVIGSGLQLMFITTLSLLPALFYFQFDRQKLSTLRSRFFRSVVTIDPDVRTLKHAYNVYGDRAADVLGTSGADGGSSGGTRLAVIQSTTLLVTLGWITTLNPMNVVASVDQRSVLSYFAPEPATFVYAFLGAYVFGVGMLFRRYVRSDLTPEAYAHFAVRVISAVLIAWAVLELPMSALQADSGARIAETAAVVQDAGNAALGGAGAEADPAADAAAGGTQIPDTGAAATSSETAEAPEQLGGGWLALAFFIGFFPETGLSLLKRGLTARTRGFIMKEDHKQIQLERLDGVNLYHQSRLLEEGIESVENLAHADIIELMLDTRIPLPTLVDWIDQSILLIHMPDEADHSKLVAHGIRTATDLQGAYAKAVDRDDEARFLAILPSTNENAPPPILTVLDAIADDQWMRYLERSRQDDVHGLFLSESDLPFWDRGDIKLREHVAERDAD